MSEQLSNNKKNPKISVLMSAYNSENTIIDSIQSILNQEFKDFEFLISDDKSLDKTKFLIDSFNDVRIKTFHNKENLGYLETWNKLINHSSGDYIIFQDSDDISYPKRLKKLNEFLDLNDDYLMVGGNFDRVFDKFGDRNISNFPNSDFEIREVINYQIKVPFYKPMYRKVAIKNVGGFRTFYKGLGCEDWDLNLRVLELGKVANLKDVLYEWKYYPTSSSRLAINSDAVRVFIGEISLFFYKQRLKYGKDVLDLQLNPISVQFSEYESYIKKLEVELDKDRLIVFSRIVRNKISNRDNKNAFIFYIKNIKTYKYSIKAYFLFFYILKSAFKSKLFFFKNALR